MKYENQALIDGLDNMAKNILDKKPNNKYRDRFFPEVINRLNLLVGVEIGVDKAEFSEHLLDRSHLDRLYCVDTWMNNFGSDCKPGEYDKDGNVRFEEAKKKLDKYKGRVYPLRMTSAEASVLFKDETLDFVYIDGDHSLEGVYVDLKCWLPKLRIGGIIAGHDYKDGPDSGISDYFGNQLPYAVKTVVDNIGQRYGYAVREVGGLIKSWYFTKNQYTLDDVKAHLIPEKCSKAELKSVQKLLSETANDPDLVIKESFAFDLSDLKKFDNDKKYELSEEGNALLEELKCK